MTLEIILTASISAGLGVLIGEIFKLINKKIDYKKAKLEREEQKRDEYLEKKERVYIAAISRLSQIRQGFDYTREMLMNDQRLREEINKNNENYAALSPQLRLYANDKIFNIYKQLYSYNRYAYAAQNAPRLFEESKHAYDIQITVLSRLMQEDLGYRRYDSEPDTLICPDCGYEHDIVGTCPNCKMTFAQLQIKLNEIINQGQSEISDDT